MYFWIVQALSGIRMITNCRKREAITAGLLLS